MANAPYEQILEASPDIYCVIDPKGNFIHVNRSSANILGYQPGELIGKPFLDMVVAEDRKKTLAAFQGLLQGRPVVDFTNHYCRKDRSIIALTWSCTWDKENQLVKGVAYQKTENKEGIKQSQDHYLNAYDRMTDGYLTLDQNWRITYTNKTAETILGNPKEHYLNHSLWECFPFTKGTIYEQEYKRAVQQRIPVHFEAYYPEPLNRWLDISAYPSQTGLAIFFRDITERKRVEEEMSKLSFILKRTNNLVILSDAEGRIKWVNDAFIQKTGYSFEEAVGKRPGDLLAGPETDYVAIKQARKQYGRGVPFQLEVLYYTKNKEKLWVEITGQPILDTDGSIKEIFSIQTDITKSRWLQDQLNREREEYQRKLTAAVIQAQEQERSEIGKELHDNINQVLTTVKLYLETCLRGYHDAQHLMTRGVQLLQDTINDIRNLSKRLSVQYVQEMRLEDSVQELVESLSLTNKLSITVQMDDLSGIRICRDLHLAIYRILQEHLTNIIKHSGASCVQVFVKTTEATLSLIMVDDGRGFDPKQKRSGIGIINMKSRAKSLGGQLKIISSPGHGCTLLASFPLKQ